MHAKKTRLAALWGLSLGALLVTGAAGQTPLPADSPTVTPAIPQETPQATPPAAESPDTQELLAELRDRESWTHTEMSLMVTLMGTFLGLITLAFGFLGLLGYQNIRDARKEIREVQRVRTQAQGTLAAAQATVSEAQEASVQIQEMRQGLGSANDALENVFKQLSSKLLKLESGFVLHVAEAPPERPAEAYVFEDSDTLLLVHDSLRLHGDPVQMAQAFVKVGLYWRVVREYGRAVARLERAVQLAPDAENHRHLGKTLAYWEAFAPSAPPIRQQHLDRAIQELETSRQLKMDANVLHDLAWAYDEKGDLQKALDFYQQGRDLHRIEAKMQGKPEQRDITYNLVCALVRADLFEEALKELEPILDKDENWKAVKEDPDLEKLRTTPPWNERLAKMVERATPR